MNKVQLLTATSVMAITAVLGMRAASAQDDSDIEQVVVSASRISLAGYQQPTPVTVVGSEQLERDAQASLTGMFSQMPQFGSVTSPESQNGSQSVSSGGAGAANINLRNIGSNRTLILINNTRVVAGDYNSSAIDINMIPDVLIRRVDIVTGGASAVWGSDAVAGVVNFVMDNNFTGLKGGIEVSDDQWDIREEVKVSGAWGTSFLGDRGHLVIGGSYWDAPQNPLVSQAPYSNYGALMNNPAYTPTNGQPQLLNIRGGAAGNYVLGFSAQTSGGLVATGPLKGLQFSGPAGTPTTTFNFGNVTGPLSYGGSAQTEIQAGLDDAIALPIKSINFYGNASYNLFGNVKANLELNYSGTHVSNTSATNQTVDTIQIDNAYLQAYPQVIAQMVANHLTSIPVGTTNINDVAMEQQNVNRQSDNSVGLWKERSVRTLERGVFSLAGTNNAFGTDWSWSGTYQHSENHRYSQFDDVSINSNYNNAVDAVFVTAANAGTSGLQIGSVACRSTLTNPTNGCQPLDVLGDGVASQQAIQYVSPGPGNPLREYEKLKIQQDTANITIQGEPFSLWAGPVALAFGGDYRKDAEAQTANALSYAKGYAVGNFQPFNFHYDTQEAFGEINAPILENSFVESLEFDGAGRYTNYSTSGGVETWKLGLISQVNGDLRLRTSWSTDIRAPGLYELFNPGSFAGAQTIPGQTQTTTSFSGGNKNLKPEVAINLEVGAVVTPHWVEGLTMSLDYWSINVHGAVITPNNTQILTLCRAGQQVYCNELTGYPGVITQVASVPINAATTTESGADFQADYVQDIFTGSMHVAFKGTYTDHLTTTSSIGRTDTANSLNGDTGGGGAPKFRGTLSATYDEKPWSFTVQTRLIGAAALNNLLQVGTGPTTYTGLTPGLGTIAKNYVPPDAYLDLRGSYNLGDHYQLYGAIDNILDTPPPYIPSTPAESNVAFFPAWSSSYYDTFGRVFRVGIRVSY